MVEISEGQVKKQGRMECDSGANLRINGLILCTVRLTVDIFDRLTEDSTKGPEIRKLPPSM